MVALSGAPLQIREMIVFTISVNVQHIRKVIWIRHESLCNEPMHLECLALQSDATIALPVVGRYAMPCLRTAICISSTPYGPVIFY